VALRFPKAECRAFFPPPDAFQKSAIVQHHCAAGASLRTASGTYVGPKANNEREQLDSLEPNIKDADSKVCAKFSQLLRLRQFIFPELRLLLTFDTKKA